MIVAVIGLALALFGRCGTPAHAQPVEVVIPLEDTTIMSAHKHNNDGGWGYAWIKTGNGINRVLVRADLGPLAGVAPGDVLHAALVVRVVWGNLTDDGTAFAAHADDPTSPLGLGWTEGSGRFDHMVGWYCGEGWARPSLRGTGRGATWACADDPNIADGKATGCDLPWTGGDSGFLPTPSAVVTVHAEPGCLWPVAIPVTEDVRAALGGRRAWLLKRAEETGGPGAMRVLSREGATCVGEPPWAPHVVVTLREGVTVGPVPALPDPCAVAGY